MRTIWKFTLPPDGSVMMPVGAEILCVQTQFAQACIWALVDPDKALIERKFNIIGTGWRMSNSLGKYIGTFQLDGGALVFHVFEKANTV